MAAMAIVGMAALSHSTLAGAAAPSTSSCSAQFCSSFLAPRTFLVGDSRFSVNRRTFRCRSLKPYGIKSMAPEEEKMTKRSPLDFPIEWDRPAPARRPDIFPQFSPMKAPLPPPLPADPPEEEEDEEEEKEEEEEEGDKPPQKEPEKPKE